MIGEPAETPDRRLLERLKTLSPQERAFVEARLRDARTARSRDTIPRRDPTAAAPLSFEQELLWRIEQTIPDRSTYNVPRAMRVHGPLDVDRLSAALDALVVRHDALRTRAVERAGCPLAVTMPAQPVELRRVALARAPDPQRETELEETLRRAASKPFDLHSDQLLRAMVVDIDEDERALLIVWHHFVSDAVSADILMTELGALYAGVSLPAPALRYADFATWQRERFTSARREALLAYWRPQLAGSTPRLTMPGTLPGTGRPSFDGARRSVMFARDVADGVARLAGTHGTTPFIVLLAGFETLLHRYGGEENVVVATVQSGRDRPELEHIVGYFASVLPLRTSLGGDPTFSEVLRRVQESYFGASEHADVPLETLLLEATPHGGSWAALPVMFTALTAEPSTPPLQGVSVEPITIDRKVAKFDLTVAAAIVADGLRLAVEYRTDLCDAATIDRMCGHFGTLLEGAIAEPATRIATLPLLAAPEHAQLAAWNRTATAGADDTLDDLIERAVAAWPQAVAVAGGERRLTFSELSVLSDRLAARLARSGVGPDVLVGVYMERVPELIVALLAIIKAGGAYVPLDTAYPADRIAFMLRDAEVKVCLTQPHLTATLAKQHSECSDMSRAQGVEKPPRLEIIALGADGATDETDDADDAAGRAPLRKATPDSLAYVIYTSGSTGSPKGAMIRHRGLVNYLQWCTQAYDVAAGCGAPVHSSISFDLTVTSLWAPLVAGRTAFLVAEDGIEALARVLRNRPNFSLLKCTPAHLAALRLELAEEDVSHMCRVLVIGGEALWGESLAWWQERAPRTVYVNEYGPTETVVGCAARFVRSDERISGAVPIGHPIAATQLHVLDRQLQPVPVGIAGELFIGGSGVAAGYLGRPALTAERFLSDPFSTEPGARMYRSGDVVRRHEDGALDFLGRLDDQVKVRGYRIELGEIEAALASHPAVAQAAVALRDDVADEPIVIGYYVLQTAATATNEALRSYLRARLPAHMVPNIFAQLATIALTHNGKIDRAALPKPDPAASLRGASPAVAPRNAVESEIAARVAALLGCASPGVHDDFFELGGHSLTAMRLLAAVTTAFGVRVSLGDFFAAPTVAALAQRVAAAPGSRYEPGGGAVARTCADEAAPLTAGQTLLWLQEQSAPGLAVYNVPLAFRVRGTLDVAVLQRTLDTVVARHAALRMRFLEHDGEPQQLAGAPYQVEFSTFDVGDRGTPDETAAAAERCLVDIACAPFDLTLGQLLRGALVRESAGLWRFLLVTHHLVFDGWSAAILLDELSTLYDAFRSEREALLPPLTIAFADYAVWEHDMLAAGRLAVLQAYWRKHLRGIPRSLGLPADHSARADGTARADGKFAGATVVSTLPAPLLHDLTALAQRHRATLFMLLGAAFATLLGRWSGQNDVVIGTPVAGRIRPETGRIIGDFASVVALRADLSDDPTFLDLLERTRQSTLGAFDHADVPVEALVPHDRAPRTALFEAMLVLQDDAPSEHRLGAASVKAIALERSVADLPLTLTFARQTDGLRASLRYRADIFAAETIGRTLAHLRILLEGIVAAPRQRLSELPLLAPQERRFVVERCNATARPYPRNLTLRDLLRAQAARTPSAVALVWENADGTVATRTYGELQDRAAVLALRLRGLGVGPGVGVGVFVQRGPELLVATVAVLEAGGYYVPFDPDYPEDRLRFMIEDSGVAVLLTQSRLSARLPPHGAAVVIVDDAMLAPVLAAPPAVAPALNPSPAAVRQAAVSDPAYMIYTSGSTGRPKGALNSHAGIVNRLLWMNERWPLRPEDVILQKTPFSFDVSVWELFWPLIAGARLVMARPGGHRDPAYLGDVIERYGVTIAHFVPSMLRAFLADPAVRRCTSLRHVMCSGEALAPELVPAFYAQFGAELHNLYGPTEAAIDVTHWTPPRGFAEATVPLGRPVANTQIYILDRRQAPVPIGVAGELSIGGVQVGLGYHRRPELTAAKFVPDPFAGSAGARLYRTGDLARYRPDGTIEFLGRLDDQVKLRGVRIEIGEIESVLGMHPLVQTCAVTLHAPRAESAELVAYYVPRTTREGPCDQHSAADENGTPPDALLRTYLRTRLPDAMVPNLFVQLDALPLGPSGKLDRTALPLPDTAAARARSAALIAPRSATEDVLRTIFSDVLAIPPPSLGIDEDFFEAGGHSLLAMRAVARSGTVLRARASVRSFFEHPTVRGFAAALARAETVPGRTEAVARAVQSVAAMTPQERKRRETVRQNA